MNKKIDLSQIEFFGEGVVADLSEKYRLCFAKDYLDGQDRFFVKVGSVNGLLVVFCAVMGLLELFHNVSIIGVYALIVLFVTTMMIGLGLFDGFFKNVFDIMWSNRVSSSAIQMELDSLEIDIKRHDDELNRLKEDFDGVDVLDAPDGEDSIDLFVVDRQRRLEELLTLRCDILQRLRSVTKEIDEFSSNGSVVS